MNSITSNQHIDNPTVRRRRQCNQSQNVIRSHTFDELAFETIHETPKPPGDHQALHEVLAKHFIFAALNFDEKQQIIEKMIYCSLEPGEVLFKQNSIARFFFVIDRGELEIIIDNVKVREMGPGQYLGDLALLYNTPRTASVRAVGPVWLWALDSAEFKSKLITLKRNHHATAFQFLEQLDCFRRLTNE